MDYLALKFLLRILSFLEKIKLTLLPPPYASPPKGRLSLKNSDDINDCGSIVPIYWKLVPLTIGVKKKSSNKVWALNWNTAEQQVIPMTLSWEVERVLSLKLLNIDGFIDPFRHLGQIYQGGGQKFKVLFIFPRIFPGLLPLYVQFKIKLTFSSFVILPSYFFFYFFFFWMDNFLKKLL